jgi:hypothetical protein
MRILTRADALAFGLKRYFTGEPCPHGHVVERRVSDFSCLECCRLKDRSSKERERRREYMRDHQRRYRRKRPDLVKATEQKRDKEKRAAAKGTKTMAEWTAWKVALHSNAHGV